ncbi:cell wall metabolism sensor histidine kinase WalK [Candidatus Poribacteria bacterium]|nr:cell wall metabolism sensor histidine kinase WalK [Candidatus Poribacteria bacterium]
MKRLRLRMGLRWQLVLLFLLVSLIPLLIVASWTHQAGTRGLTSTIRRTLVEQAQYSLDRADRVINERLHSLRRLSLRNISRTVVSTNNDNRLSTLKSAYEDLLNSIGYLERRVGENGQIIITNRNQQVIFATDKRLLFHKIDEPWWHKAYNNGLGDELIGNVQYDVETQQHTLPIAVPIPGTSSESKAVGILRVVIPLPKLAEVTDSKKEGLEICLFDKHGRIICAPPASGHHFPERIEMTEAAMSAINAGTEYYGSDMKGETNARGEQRISGWARTKSWGPREDERPNFTSRRRLSLQPSGQNFTDWRVLVSLPTSLAFKGVTEFTKDVLRFTLISCLVVIAIALVVSQRIVRPIRQVTGAARAIGRGEFDQEIPVTGSNEVGILAEEFNSMRWNLKSAVEKLTEEEKKMTAIVNSIAEGLILVDSNNRILHINPAAERLLDLSQDNIDKDITELIQNDELIQIEQAPSKNEDANFVSEITLIHHDEKLVLRTIASPFLDENGQTLGTVYLFDDITREKEIDQMKSDFISLVSHELRTPLTSIIGFVSFILDGKAGAINDRQRNSLARVQRQSKRLAALINDLLDISRIESGRIQMDQEPISLLEIITQRIEEIRPQADEKAIRLVLTAPESVSQILGDEARMGQVFTNLIGNAIKFTPDNGEVNVKVEADGNLLHVEVIDTGPGIPPEERQKIFDKFYQLSDISTRQQGGSGLGLSISKSIVEAHGGKLWIDDGNQGKGSNFQFVLPLVREDENVKSKGVSR